MITEQTHKILAISLLQGIGKATLGQIVKMSNFEEMRIEELAQRSSRLASSLKKYGLESWDIAQQKRDEQIEFAKQNNCRILSVKDSEYPELLALTNDAPPLLFVKGGLLLNEKAVAVIGTRKPSAKGKELAREATKKYASKGVTIVSGLAVGCDSIAHETALECKGHTIAVLAHGLQTVEPAINKKLAARILDEGGHFT